MVAGVSPACRQAACEGDGASDGWQAGERDRHISPPDSTPRKPSSRRSGSTAGTL